MGLPNLTRDPKGWTYRPGDSALSARERHENEIALDRIRRTLERQAEAEAIRQFVNEESD